MSSKSSQTATGNDGEILPSQNGQAHPNGPAPSKENIENPYFASSSGKPVKAKGLPPWLNHFNAKDLKNLFKCSMAVWIATIFIFIDPVLDAYGTATFFGCILLFIIPCNGIVFVHLMGGLTMIIGMALGWAWGVISMKAALATRPAAETNARLAQLAAEAQRQQTNTEQATGQPQYTQVLIFEGFMLDTRVTITYFCMLGLFIYLVARIRVAAPKLALTQVFALVVTDIFLTIGPLLPTFSGTIPSVLVKPAATAVGIGIVCNILFFPESTSHLVLEGIVGVVSPMRGFLDACLLSFENPSAEFSLQHLQQTKAQVIGAYKGLEASLGFLALDISTGRWNTEDISTLKEPLRQVTIMFMGLLQLQVSRVESKTKGQKLQEIGEAMRNGDKEHVVPVFGHHHLSQALNLHERHEHPETEDLLWKSMRALLASSGGLVGTCGEAVEAIVDAIHNVNSRRWFKRPSNEECEQLRVKHDDVLRRLKSDQSQFAALTTQHLLDPHNHLFDANGQLIKEGDAVPVHGLLLGLVLEERLLGIADALSTMLSQVILLEQQRQKTRIWPPTGLRHTFAWVFGKTSTPSVAPVGALPEQAEDKAASKSTKKKKAKEQKDPGAQEQLESLRYHGGRSRSAFGKILLGIVHWLGNTEGMYALRVLTVSIALALPAVFTSSTGFYYREKGLWALIMSQTGLVTYTADFVYGFVLRVIGTLLGGVFGMVCWYIGAGNGPGNPYGMSAIMALAILILMWGRLFAPPALLQAVMLMGSTTYLVVAYSWDDTHIPSYGNPGVGYSVFWRRTLLVLVGFTASAIVIFIPRPPSASRHYRRIISGSIRDSMDMYALFVASWSHPHEDLKTTSEKRTIATAETLSSIAGPLALLKFEFSSSNFDSQTLIHVTSLCVSINQSLSQLLVYSTMLPDHLKARFARVSGALDDQLIGDLMAVLTLVEQSLKTSDPLPAILPVPLIARCAGLKTVVANTHAAESDALSMAVIKEEGFRKYCVVLSAFVQLLSAADELVLVVKSAVGETHFVDVEEPFLYSSAELKD